MAENNEGEIPSQISVCPATKEDLPAIEKILRNTVQNPYGSGTVDEGEVQSQLGRINEALGKQEGDKTLVARDQFGETLGFAFFGKPDPRISEFTHSDPEYTQELKLLYVDHVKRSSGVGGRLLDAVEHDAKSTGATSIELVSGPRYMLIGTGEFYLKKGYSLAGSIPNYFEGQYVAKVFQKSL